MTDSPNDSIILKPNVLYDLDDMIQNEQNNIVINFESGCSDDNSVRHKKAMCCDIDNAISVLTHLNDEWLSQYNETPEWLTYKSQTKFEYYIENRNYFAGVTVFNIKSKEDLKKIQETFKTSFEITESI